MSKARMVIGCTPAARRGVLVCVAVLIALAGSSAAAAAAAASLPEGLDSKPLLDQLLARKAFLAEHMKSEEWKRHQHQQLEARSGPDNEQGVLIVAGGRDMFANAAISLTVLRSHIRSSIPVEIVHYGPSELPAQGILDYIKSFNGSGPMVAAETSNSSSISTNSSGTKSSSSMQGVLGPVFITDALAVAPPEKAAPHHRKLPEGIKSFPAKVYALTHVTRFKKVLLLDADSMPLIEPELLFKVPLFQRTGSIFWPDLWYNAWVNDTIYTLVGDMKEAPWVNNKHHRLVDSGQMLFDRVKHPEVLEYLWLLNSYHEWVYKHMHGDKDTFLLAFSMAGRRDMFTQVPCFTRDAMRDIPGHKHKFHHLGMVQSIPAAMLGAAMRAEGQSSPRHSSSGSSDPGRLLLREEQLVSSGGRSSWAAAIADSTSSSQGSASSSRARRLTEAAHPYSASALGVGADINAMAAGGSSSEGRSGSSSRRLLQLWQPSTETLDPGARSGWLTAAGTAADGVVAEALRLLSLPLRHAAPPISSSHGGQQWQYQHPPRHQLLLQAGGTVDEAGARQHRPDGTAEPPAGVGATPGSADADAAAAETLRLLSLPVGHQTQPSSSSQGGRQWQYQAHSHPQHGAVEGPDSLSPSSSSSSRRLLQPGEGGEGDSPAHTKGDVGMDADPMADLDDGLDGDDMGRPATAAAAGAPGARAAAAAASPGVVVGPKAPPRRPELKHVGVPVFFHRTSFNSKFFPDCLNADKIKTGYCQIEWVSVPLSSHQAGHSLKPHMFAWDANQINTTFYTQHCGRNASHRAGSPHHSRASGHSRRLEAAHEQEQHSDSLHPTSSIASSMLTQQRSLHHLLAAAGSSSPTTGGAVQRRQLQQAASGGSGSSSSSRRRRRPLVERYGLPPEHLCDKLPIGEDLMPIPVLPISLFPYMQRVLQASYEAFGVVRDKAGVKV